MENHYGDRARDDILRMIPSDGKIIGSVGCNFGTTEAALIAMGREVHGVDINADAIAIAKTRLTSARVVDPSDRQPFAKHSLDGLILADVLEHMYSGWDALAQLSQAVKPGGWIVISVPNMRYVIPMIYFLIGGDWPEHPNGIFDATHIQVMSKTRLARWCSMAGLNIDQWFDRYDPNNARRLRLFKACDLLTLHLFHSWFMFQVQVRCRTSK